MILSIQMIVLSVEKVAIICQQAQGLITQCHKFPLTAPQPHTTGDLSLSPCVSAHTHTAQRRWCSKTERYGEQHIYSHSASSLSSLLKHSAGSQPLFHCILFFNFCSLPQLPRQDSLCCLSSHLLLPTVGICLFKPSPILSGLTFVLFHSFQTLTLLGPEQAEACEALLKKYTTCQYAIAH